MREVEAWKEEAWKENPEGKAEAGREEERRRRFNSRLRPALQRAIQLPGFSSARSQGFWGPLPPGSPPLPSQAGSRVCASPSRASLSPWTQMSPPLVLGRCGGRVQRQNPSAMVGWRGGVR